MIDQYRNTVRRLFLVTAIGLLALPVASYADDALAAALDKCAVIQSDDDRLVCYDALALLNDSVAADPVAPAPMPAEQAAPAMAPAPAQPAAPAVVPAPAESAATAMAETPPEVLPLGDEIGKTGVQQDEAAPQKYSARVTRCVEHKQSGQYYFYFDNGQLWKQSNYRKLRWRECEFDVIITKGMLGFDMYIPEKDRTVRVSRRR